MEEEAIGDDDAEVTVNKVEEEMIVCTDCLQLTLPWLTLETYAKTNDERVH